MRGKAHDCLFEDIGRQCAIRWKPTTTRSTEKACCCTLITFNDHRLRITLFILVCCWSVMHVANMST